MARGDELSVVGVNIEEWTVDNMADNYRTILDQSLYAIKQRNK